MNWLPYIPDDNDVQASRSQDFEACGSYSIIHICEMLLKRDRKIFWEFSERAMAKLSDTQAWGNTLQGIVNAINQYGIILASDWPPLTYSSHYDNIDWANYYQTIPQNVLKKAYSVSVSLRKLTAGEALIALNAAPLWTIIKTSGGTNHIVAQLSETQYYDSYEIRVKNFQANEPIQSQYLLTIKFNNMPNAEFVKKTGTGEFGFYLPALSEDALKDKALNFGIPITDTNGNIDYTKAKEVSGL